MVFLFAEQLNVGCLNHCPLAWGPLPISFLLVLDSAGSADSVMALSAALTTLMIAWVLACITIFVSSVSAYNF